MKVCPEEQAGVRKDRVGNSFRRNFGNPAKDEGKNYHGKEGLKDCPRCTHERLLVPDFDLPKSKEEEEFAVLYYLFPVKIQDPVPGADNKFILCRMLCHA